MINFKHKFSEGRVRICAAVQPIMVAMMVAGISGALMVVLGLLVSYGGRKWHLGLARTRSAVVASTPSGLSPSVSTFACR